ncbi:hypothetical protein H5410_056751, partial [Solanum commersonii]
KRFVSGKYGLFNRWTIEEVIGTFGCGNNDIMEQVWSQQGCNLLFRRALNDCEIEEVAKLLEVLNDFLGTSYRYDKPIWKIYNKRVYIVKSCY